MVRLFIILIVISAFGLLHPPRAAAENSCPFGEELIVTAPRDGARTLNPSITVRGYLCHNYPLIMIRNETTSLEVITETLEICEGSACRYHFAAPVRELAMGTNRITAEIPGEAKLIEFEVIRTMLAAL